MVISLEVAQLYTNNILLVLSHSYFTASLGLCLRWGQVTKFRNANGALRLIVAELFVRIVDHLYSVNDCASLLSGPFGSTDGT